MHSIMSWAVALACVAVAVQGGRRGFPEYGEGRTYPHPITFHEHEHVMEGDVHVQTFISNAMNLTYGGVVFTDPHTTVLKMPTGKIAVSGFQGEVVDSMNQSVPLSEVYTHHWLVFNNFEQPHSLGCTTNFLGYRWGLGAEGRNTAYRYPSPYAQVTEDHETWAANIHLLRTVGVDPKWGTKACTECKGPNQWCPHGPSGSFDCCKDQDNCPMDKNFVPTKADPLYKAYYLKYTVWWREYSADVIPVNVGVITAPECVIEYNVPTNPTNYDVKVQQYTVPENAKLVFVGGHIHVGGVNITLEVNGNAVCTALPTYGTQEGVAGNEKGYLVAMSTCSFSTPKELKKGDTLTVRSVYNVDPHDPRSWNTGEHDGVMSYIYLAAQV